jgi:hypothetical protein
MSPMRFVPQTLATLVGVALLAASAAAQGSYTTYRQSCAGSVGTPQLSADVPIVGRVWTLTVTNLRPNSFGNLWFSHRDDAFGALRAGRLGDELEREKLRRQALEQKLQRESLRSEAAERRRAQAVQRDTPRTLQRQGIDGMALKVVWRWPKA